MTASYSPGHIRPTHPVYLHAREYLRENIHTSARPPTFITYLPAHEKTFMSYLQEAGYYTAVIGKQHFGESKIERGYNYEDIIDSHSPAPQNPDRNSYNQWLWDSGFKHRSELIQGNPDIRRYSEWKADQKYHVDHYVGDRGREWIESGIPEESPLVLLDLISRAARTNRLWQSPPGRPVRPGRHRHARDKF